MTGYTHTHTHTHTDTAPDNTNTWIATSPRYSRRPVSYEARHLERSEKRTPQRTEL